MKDILRNKIYMIRFVCVNSASLSLAFTYSLIMQDIIILKLYDILYGELPQTKRPEGRLKLY